MATPFEIALNNFQQYADNIDPKFGAGVRDIIATQYVSQLGAADDNPALRTVDKLTEFLNSVTGAYLKSAEAYYTTKGKIADLKVQARGNLITQGVNTLTPAPTSWILWAGLGLGALLLLRK